MTNQSKFEKTVYEVLGCIGGSIMGMYLFAMMVRYGFAGISMGIENFIKIGMGFSLVMMLATVVLSVRRLLLMMNQKEY